MYWITLIALFICVIYTASSKSKRKAILGLISIFFLVIVVFAFVYQRIYSNDGFSAFSLNDNLINAKVKQDLNRHIEEINKIERQTAVFNLIKNDFDSIKYFHSKLSHAKVGDRYDFSLSPTISLSWMKKVAIYYSKDSERGPALVKHEKEQILLKLYNDTIEITSTIFDSSKSELSHFRNLLADPKERISEKQVATILTSLRDESKKHSSYLSNTLNGIVELDFSHFIYLSTSIMTTLGTNEIYPSNWKTRIVISIQAILSLFLIGYGLDLIWRSDHL